MQIFRRTTELNPLSDVNIPVQVLRRQISDAVATEVNLCFVMWTSTITHTHTHTTILRLSGFCLGQPRFSSFN